MFESGITYLVESGDDRTVLLALEARVENRQLMWFDTVRDRSLRVDELREEEDAILVESPRGVYRFSPLTLDRYRAHVQARVEGRPEFFSDEDVQRYYARFPT